MHFERNAFSQTEDTAFLKRKTAPTNRIAQPKEIAPISHPEGKLKKNAVFKENIKRNWKTWGDWDPSKISRIANFKNVNVLK